MTRYDFRDVGVRHDPVKPEGRQSDDTFVPDFRDIVSSCGLPADALSKPSVTIPTKLFRHLLIQQVRRVPFDSDAYARANPDVANAHKKGELPSLFEHYVGTGWFENRPTGWFFVDEQWYKRRYPDLAAAQKSGKVPDLAAHFYRTGRREGRVASAGQLAAKDEWDRALKADP